MDRQSRIEAFIAAARELVGVRWVHKGRSPFGIDCLGLVVLAAAAAGRPLVDRLDYGRHPWQDGLDTEMRAQIGEAVETPEAGDIVTLRGPGQPAAGHVGVIAECQGYLTLIHSYNADSNSVVVEHRLDETWRARLCAAYRLFP